MARTKKKPGPKPMARIGIRLPPDVWQRAQWMAAEKGKTTPEVVRDILAHGTAGARPPLKLDERVIAASDEEWRAWRDAAAQVGKSLDAVIRQVMNGFVKQVFRR